MRQSIQTGANKAKARLSAQYGGFCIHKQLVYIKVPHTKENGLLQPFILTRGGSTELLLGIYTHVLESGRAEQTRFETWRSDVLTGRQCDRYTAPLQVLVKGAGHPQPPSAIYTLLYYRLALVIESSKV